MAEQEFDPHINIPIHVPDIEGTYILIKEKTYQLLKKCIQLQESLDHLSKSDEDRILDMLLSIFNTSIYAMYHLFGNEAKELELSSDLISLYLRPQTYKYLKIYTYVIGTLRDDINNVDDALYSLLEKEITQITIKNLKKEIAERKAKLKGRGILE